MVCIVSAKNNFYQLLLLHLIANSICMVFVYLFHVEFQSELQLFENKMTIIVIIVKYTRQ